MWLWISNTVGQWFLAIKEMPVSAGAMGTENLQAAFQVMRDSAME